MCLLHGLIITESHFILGRWSFHKVHETVLDFFFVLNLVIRLVMSLMGIVVCWKDFVILNQIIVVVRHPTTGREIEQ